MAGRITPARQSAAGRKALKQARHDATLRATKCPCGNVAKLNEKLCGRCLDKEQREALAAEMLGLEILLFHFYERKYIQRSDARQQMMGLQYTEAETHDLAKETARFILTLDLDGCGDRLKVEEIREALKDV